MLELFWELYQQRQIGNVRETAANAMAQAEAMRTTAARETGKTDERVDKLVLMVHAMWTLMAEKTGLTDADLLKRVTDLDAQDGTIDGRVTRPPVRCPKCDAMVCRKFNRCLFCGEEYTGGSAFETL
jgi:hypothetical protein